MKYSLIVNCAVTRTIAPEVCTSMLRDKLTLEQACDQWVELLAEISPSITPEELYRGKGFDTLVKLHSTFDIESTHVITGGLGFTPFKSTIIPYNFTANINERPNIQQKVTASPFSLPAWWRLINKERHGTYTPLADYVRAHSDNHIVIACTKLFVKYIADDILSLPENLRRNIRILLTASAVTSVPLQLRPMILPYSRQVLQHLPGNRNDSAFRAAYKYFSMIAEDPAFGELSVEDQLAIYNPEHIVPHEACTAAEVLNSHPELFDLPPDQAYSIARKRYKVTGGKMFFFGLLRELRGETIACEASDIDLAKEVFLSSNLLNTLTPNQTNEERQALETCKVFVETLKELAPTLSFKANELIGWVQQYHEIKNEPIPTGLISTHKINWLLRSNLGILGLKEEVQDSGKCFTLLDCDDYHLAS